MNQYKAGGFLSSPGMGSQGPTTPGGTARKATDSALRPLTVRQCLAAQQMHSDAELLIDGVEVSQLSVIAAVISLVTQTTNIVLNLDDGTGRIEARQWVDSTPQDEAGKWGDIEENRYVRLTGSIKIFGGKRYINVAHIRPVKDSNEIFFHYLEAMTVRTFLERGNPPKPGEEQMQVDGAGASTSAYSSGNAGSYSMGAEIDRLPPLQRKILDCIMSEPKREEGVHVASIARAVREDAHKISSALDDLMDAGLVFSTIDESHFRTSF